MVSDYPEHMLKKFEEFVVKGCLANYRLSAWRGEINHSFAIDNVGFSGGSKITYSPAIRRTQYQVDLQMLRFHFKKLFRFYSYRVPAGIFVPERNIEYFKKEAIALKAELVKFKEDTIAQYPAIIVDVRERYQELAIWAWENQYKNIGMPPESFVRKFCDDGIEKSHSLSIVRNRFRFSISYILPPTDEAEIKELAFSVYDSVVRSRRGLVFYILKKRRQFLAALRRGPRLKIAKFFTHYKKSLFYDDVELNRLLDNLVHKAILYPDIKNGEFAEDLRKIVLYLVDSQDFPIGMRYDGN